MLLLFWRLGPLSRRDDRSEDGVFTGSCDTFLTVNLMGFRLTPDFGRGAPEPTVPEGAEVSAGCSEVVGTAGIGGSLDVSVAGSVDRFKFLWTERRLINFPVELLLPTVDVEDTEGERVSSTVSEVMFSGIVGVI